MAIGTATCPARISITVCTWIVDRNACHIASVLLGNVDSCDDAQTPNNGEGRRVCLLQNIKLLILAKSCVVLGRHG